MSSSLGAFELEPVIEPSQIPSGLKISTLELCGSVLFLGTEEGCIIQFCIGQDDVAQKRFKAKELGPKSAVTFLRSASALDRLLALCDSTLMVLNASDLSVLPLSGSPKFRGVHACCVNENPNSDDPFSLQMCLGKKKQLAVISITEERLSVDKIKELPNPVKKVSMDGHYVCAALTSHYVIFNVASGTCQDLFPYEPDTVAVVARIAKEEFLLNAPGGLGMCVTAAGMSADRPPIQWTKPVSQFTYSHPYIITLSAEQDSVVVYSILDQKPKQTLQFHGGRALGNFDGKLLVASSSSVYRIHPISVKVQIEYLLSNERVDEALELAENASERGSEALDSLVNRARARAAFISLKNLDLRRAQELMIRGRVDPREVICLYPRLLPASSNFMRTVPPLHDIADVNQVSKMNPEKQGKLTQFLVDYLEYVRASEGDGFIHKKDVDTALIKLYAKSQADKLVSYIRNEDLVCDTDDCLAIMECHNRTHAAALLHLKLGNHEEAFNLWLDQLKAKTDEQFPGLQFFIDNLLHAPVDLVWRYAEYVLKQDQAKGVKIFMRRHEPLDAKLCETIVNFLQQYPKGHLAYLEYLVVDRDMQSEKMHTELAVTYLEAIERGLREERTETELRYKFRHLVLSSELVRVQYLLSRLETCQDMHQEKAMLYGKLREHEKAIRIFVHKLKDLPAAETYCDQISEGKPRRLREKLLCTLLKVCLDENLSKDERDAMMVPVVDLLNRRSGEVNGKEVMELLPPHWSLDAIAPALHKLLSSTIHQRRMISIQRALSKSANIDAKLKHLQMTQEPIFLQENSYCVLCKKPFTNCQFSRYPNGVMVHMDCMKDPSICPVTGQIFALNK